MAGDLPGIFDKIVALQEAITPPTGEKAMKAYDEPPGDVALFPCFVNIEEEGVEIIRSPGLRQQKFVINMHLLFAPGVQKYGVRSRRLWVKPVIDAFDNAIRFDNEQAPVQYAPIESVSFAPVDINNTEYVAATFVLRAWLAEAFTFDA